MAKREQVKDANDWANRLEGDTKKMVQLIIREMGVTAARAAGAASQFAPTVTGRLSQSLAQGHGVFVRGNEIIGVYGTNVKSAKGFRYPGYLELRYSRRSVEGRIGAGTPQSPYLMWKAKRKRTSEGAGRAEQIIPFMRPAWLVVVGDHERRLAAIGGKI